MAECALRGALSALDRAASSAPTAASGGCSEKGRMDTTTRAETIADVLNHELDMEEKMGGRDIPLEPEDFTADRDPHAGSDMYRTIAIEGVLSMEYNNGSGAYKELAVRIGESDDFVFVRDLLTEHDAGRKVTINIGVTGFGRLISKKCNAMVVENPRKGHPAAPHPNPYGKPEPDK
jgi:hypothetical protein